MKDLAAIVQLMCISCTVFCGNVQLVCLDVPVIVANVRELSIGGQDLRIRGYKIFD